MSPSGAGGRYGAVAQGFHWLTAVLVIAAYVVSPGGPEARVYGAAAEAGRRLHETLGLAVFALSVLRLLWRRIVGRPASPPMPGWTRALGMTSHALLYGLLLATPVAAVLGAWWGGHPLTFYGIGDVAPRLAPNHGLGAAYADLHGWLGNAILWLAGLHAGAALFHHYVRRDGVLMAMLPRFRPAPIAAVGAASVRIEPLGDVSTRSLTLDDWPSAPR